MTTVITTHAPMTAGDLAAITQRLTSSSGLFISHARTDVTRLLAEVHRLRLALALEREEIDHGHRRHVA